MRDALRALSCLHNSREDGGKKGSSHFDENVHFNRTYLADHPPDHHPLNLGWPFSQSVGMGIRATWPAEKEARQSFSGDFSTIF